MLQAHDTIVPWQLWHNFFFKCQNCFKKSFSQRENLNNIFKNIYIWNGILKMNLIIQQTCAKAAKVWFTTIFDQNRAQKTHAKMHYLEKPDASS